MGGISECCEVKEATLGILPSGVAKGLKVSKGVARERRASACAGEVVTGEFDVDESENSGAKVVAGAVCSRSATGPAF